MNPKWMLTHKEKVQALDTMIGDELTVTCKAQCQKLVKWLYGNCNIKNHSALTYPYLRIECRRCMRQLNKEVKSD